MKFVFVDVEFTGEHAHTTLVSLGLVTIEGASLSVTLKDYDRDLVTPWLRENVLAHIDESTSVDRREAYERVSTWLLNYAAGDRVSLVSAGKLLDLILLFELWEFAPRKVARFHHLHCLPPHLNHAAHFDLPTVFFLAGVDPNIDRETFAGVESRGKRHEALYDATVVRECFRRCISRKNFPQLAIDPFDETK